jgi:hypothetical protein
MTLRLLCLVLTVSSLSGGCAAIGLSGGALAVSALSTGTGQAVKAGTEYQLNGVAYRTFVVSSDLLEAATFQALARMGITPDREELQGQTQRLVATAGDRTIDVLLTPLASHATSLRLVVKRGLLARDTATASTIINEIESALGSGVACAPADRVTMFPP